jgi:hypothetical protein
MAASSTLDAPLQREVEGMEGQFGVGRRDAPHG